MNERDHLDELRRSPALDDRPEPLEWLTVVVLAFGVGAFIFAAGVIVGVHLR